MYLTLGLFLLGFIFLIKGADFLVEGSSSIAKKYGISSLVIGLTIVAFGTSTPELMVSIMASAKGSVGISLGNVIGSNITNTLLFFGIAAIISPLVIRNNTVNKEIPFSLLAVMAVTILVNDSIFNFSANNILSRADGLILILFFIIFIYYTFGIKKTEERLVDVLKKDDIKKYNNFISIAMIIAGILGLYFGGQWIVNGASVIARYFGLSEAFIALTIIAIGTSLPELVASGLAAKRGYADMAVGNIVGTNIFNLFFVLGSSSIVRPINFLTILNVDLMILFGITVMLLLLIYIGKKNILDKKEGVALIFLYILYIGYLIYRG